MDTALPQDRLRELLDDTLRRVTQTVATIRLGLGQSPPGEGLHTVYITFAEGFRSGLALCAPMSLFIRLAQDILCTEKVAPRDVEDVAKEYFNVVCGHVAAELYRLTKRSARLHLPAFCAGSYIPEGNRVQFTIDYVSDRAERARLVHYVPAT